jgi:hypothetical protein
MSDEGDAERAVRNDRLMRQKLAPYAEIGLKAPNGDDDE